MSAAVLGSPLQGVCGKRSLYENIEHDYLHSQTNKRFRCGPAGRHLSFGGGFNAPDANLARLVQLFPDMSEQAIADVLEKCGNDIDAAIKSLTDLRLGAQSQHLAGGGEQAGAEHAPAAAEASEAQASGTAPRADEQAGAAQAGPRTAAEWVETVVAEMASAKDIDDARMRAAKVLQGFEVVVRENVGGKGSDAAKENAILRAHVEELVKDNTILKRAVAIQNSRQQEAANKDQMVQALRQQLMQYQEQLRSLEMSNYTLSFHLRQAQGEGSVDGMGGGGGGGGKSPDHGNYNRDIF